VADNKYYTRTLILSTASIVIILASLLALVIGLSINIGLIVARRATAARY